MMYESTRMEMEFNGELLESTRESLGLTQEEFGRLLDVDGECINEFEKNGIPNHLSRWIQSKISLARYIAVLEKKFDVSGNIYYCPEPVESKYHEQIIERTKWLLNLYR